MRCDVFFFSSRGGHTRCALVTGVRTCALPIWLYARNRRAALTPSQRALGWLVAPATVVISVALAWRSGEAATIGIYAAALGVMAAKIGRASCRERVCQSGLISGVAV